MSAFFVDTSGLVKRYLSESGSVWVRSWIEPHIGNELLISALTTVEMVSALMRREREGFVTPPERLMMQNDFLRHVQDDYTVIAVDEDVLSSARDLLIKPSVRSLDAIQLSTALRAARVFSAPPIFVSADTRLLVAAAAEGLPTDDPNAHP